MCVCVIMLSTIGENGFAVNCCRLEKKLCFFPSPVIYLGHLLFCSVCVRTEGRKEFCKNASQVMQKNWGASAWKFIEIEGEK